MYAFKEMRHFSKLCSWCSHLAVQSPHSNSLHHTTEDTLCSHLSGSYLQKESDQDLLPTFLHKHKSLGLSFPLNCNAHHMRMLPLQDLAEYPGDVMGQILAVQAGKAASISAKLLPTGSQALALAQKNLS